MRLIFSSIKVCIFLNESLLATFMPQFLQISVFKASFIHSVSSFFILTETCILYIELMI